MKSLNLNTELLSYFIDHLKSSGKKSQATIKNIERDLNRFVEFMGEREINSKELLAYIDILEAELNSNSFEAKLSSLRQFLNWLNPVDNPFRKKIFKSPKSKFKIYSEEEIYEKLSLEAFDYASMIVLLIYETSSTLQELIKLNISDYNQAAKVFLMGRKEIKVNKDLQVLIDHYLKTHRPSMWKESFISLDSPFLIDEKSNRLTANKLRALIARFGLKANYLTKSKLASIEKKEVTYRLLKAYQDFHPRALMKN
jgi:site-specific recombinase XerD